MAEPLVRFLRLGNRYQARRSWPDMTLGELRHDPYGWKFVAAMSSWCEAPELQAIADALERLEETHG